MKTKAKIKHAKSSVLPERIERSDVRVMISLRMPGDLLDRYRELARARGIPYQTLIQHALREYAEKSDSVHERLNRLEDEVQRIKKMAG